MFIASSLPDIILRQFSVDPPEWLPFAQIGALLLLVIVCAILAELARTQWFHPRSRCAPSRLVGYHARIRMERYTFKLEPANELGRTSVPRPRPRIVRRSHHLALTLIGSGLTRRDLFLRWGDLAAPAQPEPILSRSRRPIPWTQFGPILLIVFGVVLPLFLIFLCDQIFRSRERMWRFLPWGLADGSAECRE